MNKKSLKDHYLFIVAVLTLAQVLFPLPIYASCLITWLGVSAAIYGIYDYFRQV